MPTLVGILLDCSKSTKENLYEKLDKKDGKRSRSIFTVIDELIIKENILPRNKMFAIGFGAKCVTQTIDIIGTLKQFQERYAESTVKPNYSENYEKVIKILENGGAYSIRKYLTEDSLRKKIPYYLLSLVLHALEFSKEFLNKVVNCLPDVCCASNIVETAFGVVKYYAFEDRDIDGIVKGIQECFLNDETLIKQFLKDEVDVFDYNTAAHTIRYWFEGKVIDDNKIQKVLKTIEPFIYGDNCLFKALEKSIDIFQMSEYSKFRKYLFVLSDGAPSDVGDIETSVSKLKSAKVKVISCYVSNSLSSVPSKKLFNEEGIEWEKGAKFMFKLCSTIKTQILPYIIFENYGWSIDTHTNETKLFLQVNHPDHISEACETAKKLVSSQDALLELLGDISLSGYIQTANKQAPVTDQEQKKTCYAHAVSAVLHLAMKRIHKRVGGHPDLIKLRIEIEHAFGTNGAFVLNVLDKFCRDYRLRYRTVDEKGAMQAIASKRPIIATFFLKGREWNTFSEFFEKNPTGVLTKNEIDINKRGLSSRYKNDGGHAVVLTSFNSESFLCMNSWGGTFGDKGFFRVQNVEVLDFEFFDVYWTEDDLKEEEKAAYLEHGVTSAQLLVRTLKGLSSAKYMCKICLQESLVFQFGGTFERAICPKKGCEFECTSEGNTLAMNLYRTTFSR